jgi:hypothetical protein
MYGKQRLRDCVGKGIETTLTSLILLGEDLMKSEVSVSEQIVL